MKITEFKTEKCIEYNVIGDGIELRQLAWNDGSKHNEVIKNGEFISPHSEEAKHLFIALHNYKCGCK